ncbi:MAG: PcfJ domain-containing protein [Lachnospiraceae bacterium]|nr:PcfJ domain-containing protein [Lachnospiraceae bacterium]
MGKSFFVKSPETGACYCGKCGKRQLTDLYNMQKHAQICDPQFSGKDEVLVVEEGRSWGYLLESAPGVLTLSICAPFLNRIRGFKDRFSGMEWIPVFAAEFAAGTRNPNILRNDTGYDMEVLLSLIRAGRIIPISTVRDSEVIRQVFPCIDIYSLQMFAHIYKCKGFTANKPIKPATESWLFEKTPGSKEWKDLEKNLTPVPGKIPIYAAVYKHRNDLYILQVVLKKGQEKTVFLFTRGYCSCSREVDLNEIFRQQYYLVGNTMKAVEAFDKAYPEYHLAMYAKSSENILTPLLAADYHTGMELAAKAGATAIAESYDKLTVFERSPRLFHNLKDLFGVSVPVLRALQRDQINDAVMGRLKEIYEYQPAFLQFESYTDSMMEFYMRGNVTHRGANIERAIDGIGALSDKQILQILRYLGKHPRDGHYYCDYMNACAQLGEYVYGITPNIPIREAHDRVVSRIRNDRDWAEKRRFEYAVNSEEYLRLATCFTEEDEETFGKDPYMVTTPETSDDLFRESENMHNCVRIYVPRVARKSSRIYFLREKEKPDKSYGTIEVSGDGSRLIQAKAFANRRLPGKAQRFMVKWCRSKRIRIDTRDITEKPYGIA